MDRKETLCTLCKKNEADKTNSHIVPKFLVKNMLGNQHSKRAYLLNTDRLAHEVQFSQDSDKEDRILCGECEMYFSVLETYISTRIYNRLKAKRFDNQFVDHNSGNLIWKVCKEVDLTAYRLFIYSIIFRCAITNKGVFKKFTLKEAENNLIRSYLLIYKELNQVSFLEKVDAISTEQIDLKLAFLTCESFFDPTENMVGIHPAHMDSECHCLLLNEY